MHRQRPGTRLILSLSAAAILSSLTGCYERVVSAKGYGTKTYTIHEPASEDVMFKSLDRWIMGEPGGAKKKK